MILSNSIKLSGNMTKFLNNFLKLLINSIILSLHFPVFIKSYMQMAGTPYKTFAVTKAVLGPAITHRGLDNAHISSIGRCFSSIN